MRDAIASCWKAIRQAQPLRERLLLAGSAETADISLLARKPRKNVRYALILEHILKEKLKIIKTG